MTKPIHIDPRRPWSRDRKFGWDALPGTASSIIPDLVECEGRRRPCPYMDEASGICLSPRCVCFELEIQNKINPPWKEGVPVGSGGAEKQKHHKSSGSAVIARTVGKPRETDGGGHASLSHGAARLSASALEPEISARPTALPNALSEGLNVVLACALAAFVLLAAGVAHMEAPDRQVKVYSERME